MNSSFTLAMISALYCNQGPVVDGAKCQDGSPAHTIELEFLTWQWPSDAKPRDEPSTILNISVDGKVTLALQPGNLTHQQLLAIAKAVAPTNNTISFYGSSTVAPSTELPPTEPKPHWYYPPTWPTLISPNIPGFHSFVTDSNKDRLP